MDRITVSPTSYPGRQMNKTGYNTVRLLPTRVKVHIWLVDKEVNVLTLV